MKMNSRFKPDTSKLNLKFDGYKLAPLPGHDGVQRVALAEGNIQLYKPSHDQRFGFRDLQARIRYSHLIYGYPLDQNRGSCFCIDYDFNVHMIVYDKLTKETKFALITQLIKPLVGLPGFTEPKSSVPLEPQMPSAIAVSKELLVATNGVGDIELIGFEEKDGNLLGTSLGAVAYTGTGTEGISPVPCVLLAARQIKSTIILVVYSRAASTPSDTMSIAAEFHIATLKLHLPTEHTKRLDDGSFVLELDTMHIQKGAEVPVYCAITPSGQQIILGSEVKYNTVHPVQEQDEPMEEAVDPPSPKQPSYQWTQDGADITLQFQLPANTPKSAIHCNFVVDHLSLIVKDTAISFPYRKLWGTVQPDESTWTIDKDGLLTLFMTKTDERTRWPQLFDQDDGVLETLSATALSNITQQLDRFTSEPDTNMSSSFVHPSQHPAATDMDEDVDDEGTPVVFSVYQNSSGRVVDEFHSGAYRYVSQSFWHPHLPSICLQMDVDGLVFSLTETEDGSIEIQHEDTVHAFAFVQASKRDARFIHIDPECHFASIVESSRNAYIYYHHQDKRLIEQQALVDLTQGSQVDIVGVQRIFDNTLMVLTESHVVILHL
ncbi:NudC domain-containing protein 1 [Choanephora cucurbitarum]|uniref:NudC domain-containing protein 1 n=1 Tax=Choanephora cucurbitarum TaxID=101091 RepID=A0A1C7NRC7_9FUNG|nr:NudC domain-containing protein 1 [Choanephora cucurbitarum]